MKNLWILLGFGQRDNFRLCDGVFLFRNVFTLLFLLHPRPLPLNRLKNFLSFPFFKKDLCWTLTNFAWKKAVIQTRFASLSVAVAPKWN